MNTKEFSPAERAFWLLLFFLSLFFVALGSGIIFFQIINSFFPEPYSGLSQGALRTGFSFVLVAAPLAFFSAQKLHNGILKKQIPFESAVRRWLGYAALFFAAATFMGDFIAALIFFLNGELTIRVLLKVVVLFVIAGGIFGFLMWDLREDNLEHRQKNAKFLFAGFWGFVAIALVSSVFFLESPAVARDRRLDQETENNLSSLKYSIEDFYQTKNKLPENLAEIESDPMLSGRFDAKDIEYMKKSKNEYELCTDFRRDNRNDEDYREWTHPAGRFCFSIVADTNDSPKGIF